MTGLFDEQPATSSPGIQLRDYQTEAVASLYAWFDRCDGNPLIVAPTGCHAAGTPILRHDGSVVPVEDLGVGDLLMGPDGTPRLVMQLCRGREPLYRVTPTKGESFIVNEDHILSLRTTNEGKQSACNTTGRELEAVSVRDYLQKSKSWKHLRKLHRTDAINFPKRNDPWLDAWTIGVLIGDGSILRGVNVTSADDDIFAGVAEEGAKWGLRIRRSGKPNNAASDIHLVDRRGKPNIMMSHLRDLGIAGHRSSTKFIPDNYKLGSVDVRRQVLAGLLDTDGSLCRCGFDYISKSEQLSRDVTFVARSLGLAAYVTPCEKRDQHGNGGVYWRVSISGNTALIPTRVPRKRAPERLQKKRHRVTGFTVEPVGVGDFYGFTLDADHLYLDGNFTVHHNSGKSIILTAFVHSVLSQWPKERILVLTHVRELIAQNHAAMLRLWPGAPAGICSAGIGRREWDAPILFAGIQTIHKRAARIGWIDLVIVDEAHLIPSEGFGMYRRLLDALASMNSKLKVIGLTATPFRTDSGRLDQEKGRIFHGIAFDCGLVRLIDEGFLSPVISKSTHATIDTTGVHTKLGEFVAKELEQAALAHDLVARACDEIVARASDRRSMLLFGCGIEHATTIRDRLIERGIDCECVFGDTPKDQRDDTIARFKAGRLRAISNFGVLTTGFDAPNIDLIALMRPTKSPVLYVQMVGRGLRIAPGKTDCLVLDFGGNVMRHGPIDMVEPKAERADNSDEEDENDGPPVKECPQCMSFVLIAARTCPDCGYVFPVPELHEAKPDVETPIIAGHSKDGGIEKWNVVRTTFREHHKPGKPVSLRVDYECGFRRWISEWVCFEHDGYARVKAEQWWRKRGGRSPAPATVDQARVRIDLSNEIRRAIEVTVDTRGEYPKLLSVKLEETEAGAFEPDARPRGTTSDLSDLPF